MTAAHRSPLRAFPLPIRANLFLNVLMLIYQPRPRPCPTQRMSSDT